jgi:hypothetical protein
MEEREILKTFDGKTASSYTCDSPASSTRPVPSSADSMELRIFHECPVSQTLLIHFVSSVLKIYLSIVLDA